MQNKFNPRGIVKWAAFSAVYDPLEFSSRVNQGLFLQDEVSLSEDQIVQINDDLVHASSNQCNVNVTYFDKGIFKTVVGSISSINSECQSFKVDTTLINMSQLVSISVNDE